MKEHNHQQHTSGSVFFRLFTILTFFCIVSPLVYIGMVHTEQTFSPKVNSLNKSTGWLLASDQLSEFPGHNFSVYKKMNDSDENTVFLFRNECQKVTAYLNNKLIYSTRMNMDFRLQTSSRGWCCISLPDSIKIRPTDTLKITFQATSWSTSSIPVIYEGSGRDIYSFMIQQDKVHFIALPFWLIILFILISLLIHTHIMQIAKRKLTMIIFYTLCYFLYAVCNLSILNISTVNHELFSCCGYILSMLMPVLLLFFAWKCTGNKTAPLLWFSSILCYCTNIYQIFTYFSGSTSLCETYIYTQYITLLINAACFLTILLDYLRQKTKENLQNAIGFSIPFLTYCVTIISHLGDNLQDLSFAGQLAYHVGGLLFAIFLIRIAHFEITDKLNKLKHDTYTATAQSKEALETALAAANHANKSNFMFISRMSHDLRTPLNAITGMTTIAKSYIGDTQKVTDCLDKIHSSSNYLVSLVNEMIDMSKLESDSMILEEEDFTLSSVVDGLLFIVRPLADKKGYHLSVSVNNIEHEHVLGDAGRLQQALVYLLDNSINDANPGGTIHISLNELPSHSPKAGRYSFVIENTGAGMSKEILDIIFDPYAHPSIEDDFSSQGPSFGLAIARNIIRMMGGDIEVESAEGTGTTFIVTVFLKLGACPRCPNEKFAGKNVLVVDNSSDICQNTCHFLNHFLLNGEWVTSSNAAIEKAAYAHQHAKDYFAIMINSPLDDMDSISLAKSLSVITGGSTPLILISTEDMTELETSAKEAGIRYFVNKPLFSSKLCGIFHLIADGVEPAPLYPPQKVLSELEHSGKHILLVEDNAFNRKLTKELLEMANIIVDEAENGKIAIDMISQLPENYYDLILMDIEMPVMNGYETTRVLRNMNREDLAYLPIIAMSANIFESDIQASKDSGMNGHLPKPLTLPVIKDLLKRWL